MSLTAILGIIYKTAVRLVLAIRLTWIRSDYPVITYVNSPTNSIGLARFVLYHSPSPKPPPAAVIVRRASSPGNFGRTRQTHSGLVPQPSRRSPPTERVCFSRSELLSETFPKAHPRPPAQKAGGFFFGRNFRFPLPYGRGSDFFFPVSNPNAHPTNNYPCRQASPCTIRRPNWSTTVNRSLTRRQSTILGLVVCLGLAIGVWGLFRVTDRNGVWSMGYEVTVVATEAQDVAPGTPVRIRGIEAGKVTHVEYAGDDVHIRLKLDQLFRDKLHADASAIVQTKGIMGASVVDIKPGTSKAGPLSEPVIYAKPAPDLAEVTAKLSSVAGRVDAVLQDIQDGKGTLPKLLKDDAIYNDLKSTSTDMKKLVKNLDETTTALRGDAQTTMQNVDKSVAAVHAELDGLKGFVRSGQEAVTAIKQDAEAIKSMPIVRNYVEDHVAALVRPDFHKERMIYGPHGLFEPNTSILTEEGKGILNIYVGWLNDNKQKNSEIVVAGFADPKSPDLTGPAARLLTKKYAEAVAEYLKERGVHKMGVVSRRKVLALGFGFDPSPVVEKDPVPASRVEVILFVPRS